MIRAQTSRSTSRSRAPKPKISKKVATSRSRSPSPNVSTASTASTASKKKIATSRSRSPSPNASNESNESNESTVSKRALRSRSRSSSRSPVSTTVPLWKLPTVRQDWLKMINQFFQYGEAIDFIQETVLAPQVDPRRPHDELLKRIILPFSVITRELLADMYFCAEELLEVVFRVYGNQVPASKLDQLPILGAILSLAIKQMGEKDFIRDWAIRDAIMRFLYGVFLDRQQMTRKDMKNFENRLDDWEFRLFKKTGFLGCAQTQRKLQQLSFRSSKIRKSARKTRRK